MKLTWWLLAVSMTAAAVVGCRDHNETIVVDAAPMDAVATGGQGGKGGAGGAGGSAGRTGTAGTAGAGAGGAGGSPTAGAGGQ